MTALETRLDTILPTLATKADVGALRGDMIEQLGVVRLDLEKFSISTDATIEKAALRVETKLAELRSDMHKMSADVRSWTLATMITIVGTMLAAILGIAQIYKGAAPAPPAPQPAPIIITIPGAFAPVAPASPR
ncbi:MAG: hypothetical protein JWQ01_4109 [Massilia sp.]|nr:hypothetical protein [Massilia sp.]